jgi:hypothetical protein
MEFCSDNLKGDTVWNRDVGGVIILKWILKIKGWGLDLSGSDYGSVADM